MWTKLSVRTRNNEHGTWASMQSTEHRVKCKDKKSTRAKSTEAKQQTIKQQTTKHEQQKAKSKVQKAKSKSFPSGNWTRVTRVTGGYTNHYTNENFSYIDSPHIFTNKTNTTNNTNNTNTSYTLLHTTTLLCTTHHALLLQRRPLNSHVTLTDSLTNIPRIASAYNTHILDDHSYSTRNCVFTS